MRQFGLNEENICENEVKKEDGGKELKEGNMETLSYMGFIFLYWILCTQKRSHFIRSDWDLVSFIEMTMVAEVATKEVHHRHRIFTETLHREYFVFPLKISVEKTIYIGDCGILKDSHWG